jgi:hypothetical protein
MLTKKYICNIMNYVIIYPILTNFIQIKMRGVYNEKEATVYR